MTQLAILGFSSGCGMACLVLSVMASFGALKRSLGEISE